MCADGLTSMLANEPLWQVMQVPVATPVCAYGVNNGSQALVRWQMSQLAEVGIWLPNLTSMFT